MLTPMVRELRRTFPDSFIATLTRPATSDVFRHNPHINAILTDDLTKESFWPTVRLLREHHFTHGLLVLPTERAAWQMLWAGIRKRVTTGHRLYAVLTLMNGVSRNNYTPLRHEADYCMDLARAVGIVTDQLQPEIFLSSEEKINAADFLGRAGIREEDKKIFIHTGSGGSAPNLSEDKYLEMIRAILGTFDSPSVRIILTAKEMTKKFRQEALALAPPSRIVDIADDIGDLRSFISLIARADVMITPSTGSSHVADALNIPTIAIHCHRPMSSARHWGVLNSRSINLEVSEDYCRSHCSADQNTCRMENGIPISQVLAALQDLLAAPLAR
jgi:ADP-heptose:LPS heptosyltransferase